MDREAQQGIVMIEKLMQNPETLLEGGHENLVKSLAQRELFLVREVGGKRRAKGGRGAHRTQRMD